MRTRERALIPCLVVALVAGAAVTVGGLGARAHAEPTRRVAAGAGQSPDIGSRLARLEADLRRAEQDAVAATTLRDETAADLAAARDARVVAQARLDELDQVRARAEDDLLVAEERVAEVVRSAYVGGSDAIGLVADFMDAENVTELQRKRILTRRVGDAHERVVRELRSARRAARRAAAEARDARAVVDRRVRSFEEQFPALDQAVVRAETKAATARFDYDRWDSVRFGPATEILGAARLTGDDLARWFRAERGTARTTVPIEELTRIFIEEGDAAGVRGDIAFAQSMLETGSFYFPDYGQVRPTDNNFAGIGACDSCATGRGYPDARTGVRAQMQLLRAYADASVSLATLGNPPVDPALVSFFLRGQAPTWGGLTGTWATSTTYAPKILNVYFRMLAWVTDNS